MSIELAPRGRRTLLIALVTALLAVVALATLAQAADALTGPTLLAPNQGKHFAPGSAPTFKVRDRTSKARRYGVSIVINQHKRVKHGQLQEPRGDESGTFATMKRHRHGIFTYTPVKYTFPSWFMIRPGVYYWQAMHIDCATNAPRNCHIVSRIRHFRVG